MSTIFLRVENEAKPSSIQHQSCIIYPKYIREAFVSFSFCLGQYVFIRYQHVPASFWNHSRLWIGETRESEIAGVIKRERRRKERMYYTRPKEYYRYFLSVWVINRERPLACNSKKSFILENGSERQSKIRRSNDGIEKQLNSVFVNKLKIGWATSSAEKKKKSAMTTTTKTTTTPINEKSVQLIAKAKVTVWNVFASKKKEHCSRNDFDFIFVVRGFRVRLLVPLPFHFVHFVSVSNVWTQRLWTSLHLWNGQQQRDGFFINT